MPKPGLIVASFGTTYAQTRRAAIGGIERALQAAYPEYQFIRAFTSRMVIKLLKQREGLEVKTVSQALDDLLAIGVDRVLIQPTHVLAGFEYSGLVREVKAYAGKFSSLRLGQPLLAEDRDFDRLAQSLLVETQAYRQPGTSLVWLGHGTDHQANQVYPRLQARFEHRGLDRDFIGTVESSPGLAELLPQIEAAKPDRLVLLPLMIVAGDHAIKDLGGLEPGCWQYELNRAGYPTQLVLRGMGEYAGVQAIFVDHAGQAKELI